MDILISQYFPPYRNGISVIASDIYENFDFDAIVTTNRGRDRKDIFGITVWNDIEVQKRANNWSFPNEEIFEDPRLFDVCFAIGISGFLESHDVDNAYIISASNDYLLLYPFLGRKEIDVYLTFGGGGYRTPEHLESTRKRVLKRADKISITCKYLRSYLESVNEEKIVHIPNYIDTEKFYKEDNGEDDEFEVGYVGRIAEVKGIEDILEIADNNKDIKITLVGKAEDVCKEKIESRSNIELKEDVEFDDKSSLRSLYNSFDVILLPTYGDTLGKFGPETCPFVILEAMACGTPIISTKVDGIPEIIENGVNGFLVEPGDTEQMVEYIWELKNKELRERIVENGLKVVNKRYEKSKILSKYNHFLDFQTPQTQHSFHHQDSTNYYTHDNLLPCNHLSISLYIRNQNIH